MENIKRPTGIETDDDLLKEQEQFLKERKVPSVKLVSCKKNSALPPREDLSTEVSSNKSNTKQPKSDLEVISGDVVFDVKERDVSSVEPFVFKPAFVQPSEISHLLYKKVKPSKFALRKESQSIFLQMLNSTVDSKECDKNIEAETSSMLIDGSGLNPDVKELEMKKIHAENLSKISSMSKEEIIYHQEQLKKYLKPEILNFIQKKKSLKKDNVQDSKPKFNIVTSKNVKNKNDDMPGEILRKEGNEDFDALILEKALESEKERVLVSQEQNNIREINNSEENMNFEIPVEAKELIEGSNKGHWRNMNKIEKEKLEWMTNLPQPKPVDLKTGSTARFDFEGKLLSREEDIPTYKGLHHHGEEPEVPGYSLEELFLLARSSLQSQRITALNTIAHILDNNWCGMMDKCFDAPLLPLLLNAGIVPLLRWALDDTSLTSISATITAIHSLLISKADEACSSKTFCWLNGHLIPQLEPQGLEEPNIVVEELTDADLIKLDVVKGFLRIDILPRFMYILKAMCPPPLVCKLIIEICARLAQHSVESARQVAEYPGLLSFIFDKFLPLKWNFVDSSTLTDTVKYSCPMTSALKLVRILASASKDLALDMVENYGVVSNLILYLTLQPIDGKLAAQDVQFLAIETLKTWNSLLCYGLASQVLLDIFPILLKQLEFCLSLNLNSEPKKHLQDFDYAAHLFKSYEALTVVAVEQKNEELMSAIDAVYKQALVCLQKWIWQFSQEIPSSLGMVLLASCMNFIVTHCRKSHEGLTCENWKPCSAAKKAFETYLVPCMKSNTFQSLLKDFRSFSLFLSSEISGNNRDGKTIVSLGSVLYGEDIVPVLKEGSPLPLLTSFFNYVSLYKSSFQDSQNECIEIIFSSPLYNYLKEVSTKEQKNNCWFMKFETYFIYQLMQLSSFIESPEILIFHESAISVLPAFTPLEASLLEYMFENVIFGQSALSKLVSNFQTCDSMESGSLCSVINRLPVIAKCYVSCFLNESTITRSRNLLFRSSEIDSLFCLSTPSSIIPKDWCFMPIFNLYQKSKYRKETVNLSPDEVLQVTSCLQWIFICHALNFHLVKKIPASVEFYYLCQVFLLDDDLFRDDKIQSLLVQCISKILKQKSLKLSKINWNGITTFEDLYLELLVQYEAVSYGDETFGNFLVIPLQQNFPKQWKKLLLTEHESVLSILRVPLTKLLVPLQNFLHPVETDLGLLYEYLKVLASENLIHQRCPLLHIMAVHHIHKFLFMESDCHLENQKLLLAKILRLRKDLQKKLLLYLNADETLQGGFSMADELNAEQRNKLSKLTDVSIKI